MGLWQVSGRSAAPRLGIGSRSRERVAGRRQSAEILRPRSQSFCGDPYGTRTRVFAVRGRRPRPLDEGALASRAGHMWARHCLVKSVELEAQETHRPGRIAAAVPGRQPVGDEIDRQQPAEAERQMLSDAEVADRAGRNLADAEGRAVIERVDQLAVLRHLAAAEQGPAAVLERSLERDRIVAVAFDRLAAPRQRAGELPTWSDLAGIKRAGRPAGLVDARLELLGVDEPAPASLQREFGGRIPGQADGGGIERAGLDVPAVLVRFAAVEAADFDLHA